MREALSEHVHLATEAEGENRVEESGGEGEGHGDRGDDFLTVVTLVTVALGLVRHLLTMRENQLLTRTLEEKIDAMIARKGELASDLVREDDPTLAKQFTREQLRELLRDDLGE